MKKHVLFLGLLAAGTAFGQTFSDNFDSYTAGQYLCPQSGGAWTTWSNAPGTAEDVMVSSADASSPSNSLYFSTTAQNGGPTDLVKNFGVLNTGQFSMSFNIKVENGKAGYFNLQKNATIGQVWAMDCFFADNGSLVINNQSGLNFQSTYPQGQWFNFRLDIDFNANVWEVFINNVSAGTFANTENQIASIDIYPTDQNSPYSCGYYIDDFQYTITPYTLPALNGAANVLTYSEGNLTGTAVTPKVTVRNLGTTPITSVGVNVTYNGNTISNTFTGLNLASLASTTVTMPNTLTLAAGTLPMTASITSVNGTSPDNDAADDNVTINITPITPAAGRMVVGEEGTGTWCGWCPRGAVFMDRMETKYPDHWAGIAVHNGDPMVVTDYDAAIGQLIAGYPSALVDRGTELDPSQMEAEFLNRVVTTPTAFITNGATWDAGTRTLNVSVSAQFQTGADNNYKLAVVLTEDGVTGTTSAYNQANYYSNNAAGPMGGFESLPNPVPAANMVYDHVARAIAPSFAGTNAAFPTTVLAGMTHTLNATFILPATWDENEIHIIGMLIDPNGNVDNAGKATIAEAVANGWVNSISESEVVNLDKAVTIYPNPANDVAVVSLNLTGSNDVAIRLMDISGKELTAKSYGKLSGALEFPVYTANFAPGIYLVEVTVDGVSTQQRLVIE